MQWYKHYKDAVTVIFNEDKTGTVTFNSNKTGYTFELNKPYEFTYDFTTSSYSDRPIKLTMSSIILDHGTVTWTYDKTMPNSIKPVKIH